MASRVLFIVSLLFTLAQPAYSEPLVIKSGPYQTAVLELYTSEGCSSCPPADEWLAQITKMSASELDVLPLAFHVDYWDYIGWKDEFADPSYTQRQRHLGRLNRQSSIYTPEFFVDGKEARGTSNILKKIREANQTRSLLDMQLSIHQQKMQFQLHLSSQNNSEQNLKVQFFVYEDDLSNEVKRGENAGKTLKHQRVVRYLSPLIGLKSNVQHTIDIHPQWHRQNLGLGAMVKTANDEYVQSLHTSVLSL